jgi:hypothetical protein
MFNPKGNSLLDEQLAFSGLEMNFLDKIVQGITGHNQAKKNNAAAKSNERKLRKHQKKVARKTNEYNKKKDANDQANYHLMRDYSHETNIINYRHGKKLTDFAHAQQLRVFAKSNEIAQGQFDLNAQGASEAVEGQEASVEDMFIASQFQGESSLTALKDAYTEQAFNVREENTKLLGIKSKQMLGTASIQNQIDSLMTAGSFQKQASLVEGLLEEGKASLGQAGKSRTKAKQSTAAALQRGLVGLEAELTGKRKQAGIELAQLNAESSLAITGVGLNLEKINNAIENAEGEAEFNNRVLAANMKSFINQTERNIDEIVTKKKYADINTKSQMMLEPEFPGYNPKPTQPPERIFIKSMKAIPGFTPTAARQSTWAPLVNAAAGIATDIIGMGIGGGGSSGGGAGYSGPNFAPTTSISSVDYSFTPKLYGSPWGD